MQPDFSELSKRAKRAIGEAINSFFTEVQDGVADVDGFPTIDSFEDMMDKLDVKTKKAYLEMLSDTFSKVPEKELIASKKESSSQGG